MINEKGAEWEKEKLDPNGWASNRSSQQFNVVRRVYHQDALQIDADYQEPNKQLKRKLKKLMKRCAVKKCLGNSMPILDWLPKYDFRKNLVSDLVAGCTVAVMHIPQGMAYAMLAQVSPVVGLYMAFFPILMYVIFGTSPHISHGTFAVACLMVGKVVSKTVVPMHDEFNSTNLTAVLPPTGPQGPTPMDICTTLTLICGAAQMIMWALRLGAVSSLLSEPLVSGFTTGAAFHVMASQTKDLFGVNIGKLPANFNVIFTVVEICKNITNINWAAFVISFITCLTISLNNELLKPWVAKKTKLPVPIELLAILLGTLLSKFCYLHEQFGIKLVGNIPTGLPDPSPPPFYLIPDLIIDGIVITIVTYTISMSMALIFAARDKYEVDANQELLAMGAGNVFSAFFSCAPVCASLSRSYIQYQAGSKTHVTSIVSSLLMLCVLLWIGPFFELLPRSVLASIIVVSLKGMVMQVKELKKFWLLSKLDAIVWITTFLVTLIVNIDIGLAAGVLASIGALFYRSQRPYTCLLGRVLNTDIYLDIKRYRAAQEIPGIKIFHFCGGLNFASKNLFRTTLFHKIGVMKQILPDDILAVADQDRLTRSPSCNWASIVNTVHCVIIDATALSYVDAPGVKALISADKELASHNVTVLLAGANGPVLEMIARYNKLENERLVLDMFPTVHDAVMAYSKQIKNNCKSPEKPDDVVLPPAV